MGIYTATDEEDAVRTYVKDAGYASVAEAASACDCSIGVFIEELSVTEL